MVEREIQTREGSTEIRRRREEKLVVFPGDVITWSEESFWHKLLLFPSLLFNAICRTTHSSCDNRQTDRQTDRNRHVYSGTIDDDDDDDIPNSNCITSCNSNISRNSGCSSRWKNQLWLCCCCCSAFAAAVATMRCSDSEGIKGSSIERERERRKM